MTSTGENDVQKVRLIHEVQRYNHENTFQRDVSALFDQPSPVPEGNGAKKLRLIHEIQRYNHENTFRRDVSALFDQPSPVPEGNGAKKLRLIHEIQRYNHENTFRQDLSSFLDKPSPACSEKRDSKETLPNESRIQSSDNMFRSEISTAFCEADDSKFEENSSPYMYANKGEVNSVEYQSFTIKNSCVNSNNLISSDSSIRRTFDQETSAVSHSGLLGTDLSFVCKKGPLQKRNATFTNIPNFTEEITETTNSVLEKSISYDLSGDTLVGEKSKIGLDVSVSTDSSVAVELTSKNDSASRLVPVATDSNVTHELTNKNESANELAPVATDSSVTHELTNNNKSASELASVATDSNVTHELTNKNDSAIESALVATDSSVAVELTSENDSVMNEFNIPNTPVLSNLNKGGILSNLSDIVNIPIQDSLSEVMNISETRVPANSKSNDDPVMENNDKTLIAVADTNSSNILIAGIDGNAKLCESIKDSKSADNINDFSRYYNKTYTIVGPSASLFCETYENITNSSKFINESSHACDPNVSSISHPRKSIVTSHELEANATTKIKDDKKSQNVEQVDGFQNLKTVVGGKDSLKTNQTFEISKEEVNVVDYLRLSQVVSAVNDNLIVSEELPSLENNNSSMDHILSKDQENTLVSESNQVLDKPAKNIDMAVDQPSLAIPIPDMQESITKTDGTVVFEESKSLHAAAYEDESRCCQTTMNVPDQSTFSQFEKPLLNNRSLNDFCKSVTVYETLTYSAQNIQTISETVSDNNIGENTIDSIAKVHKRDIDSRKFSVDGESIQNIQLVSQTTIRNHGSEDHVEFIEGIKKNDETGNEMKENASETFTKCVTDEQENFPSTVLSSDHVVQNSSIKNIHMSESSGVMTRPDHVVQKTPIENICMSESLGVMTRRRSKLLGEATIMNQTVGENSRGQEKHDDERVSKCTSDSWFVIDVEKKVSASSVVPSKNDTVASELMETDVSENSKNVTVINSHSNLSAPQSSLKKINQDNTNRTNVSETSFRITRRRSKQMAESESRVDDGQSFGFSAENSTGLITESRSRSRVLTKKISSGPSQSKSKVSFKSGTETPMNMKSCSGKSMISDSSVTTSFIRQMFYSDDEDDDIFVEPTLPPPRKKTKKRENHLLNVEDDEENYLPKKTSFPDIPPFIHKHFYEFCIEKMKHKYGIKTKQEVVNVARYVAEVVDQVIRSQNKEEYLKKIDEMRKVLARKQIVKTHYEFYLFCMQRFSPYFYAKAVPMLIPVGAVRKSEIFDPDKILSNILSNEL